MIARTPHGISPRSLLTWRTVLPRGRAGAYRNQLKPATVLLASTGKPFSDTAIELAAGCAASAGASGARVRVVAIARIHGTSFGLQHPGLMPTKKERETARALVTDAIEKLQRAGVSADGEVMVTRGTARPFARAARAAGEVRHVIVDAPDAGRWSEWSTRQTARAVQRLLKGAAVTIAAGVGAAREHDRLDQWRFRGAGHGFAIAYSPVGNRRRVIPPGCPSRRFRRPGGRRR